MRHCSHILKELGLPKSTSVTLWHNHVLHISTHLRRIQGCLRILPKHKIEAFWCEENAGHTEFTLPFQYTCSLAHHFLNQWARGRATYPGQLFYFPTCSINCPVITLQAHPWRNHLCVNWCSLALGYVWRIMISMFIKKCCSKTCWKASWSARKDWQRLYPSHIRKIQLRCFLKQCP